MTGSNDAVDGRRVDEPEVTETARLLGNGTSREDDVDVDHHRLSWWRRPSVFWLLGPYLIFALTFGGMLVPKLNLIIELVCRQYYIEQQNLTTIVLFQEGSNPQCNEPAVQKRVAAFILALNLVVGILSAIVAPKLGHMSDRYGRTRLMAIASCGGLLSEGVTILAARFPDVVGHHWLILGAVFDGLGGSLAAGSVLNASYASDCSTPSTRAVSLGYITACLFGGLALGPLTAGYIVKWTGSLVAIFYVNFCCHALYITLAAFVIPESLSRQKQKIARETWERESEERRRRHSASWASAVRAWNPLLPIKVLWVTGPGTSARLRINLIALAISNTIVMGINMSAGAIIILYAEAVFSWGTFETSKFVSTVSFVRVFTLLVLSPLLNHLGRRRRSSSSGRRPGSGPAAEKNAGADRLDVWIIRASMGSDILGTLGYLMSASQAAFVVSGIVTALGGLGAATLQSVVTKHVPPGRVGQVLGAMGTMEALGRVAGPLMFNSLYALTVGTFPKAIFVLICSMYGVVFFVCSFVLKPGVYWKEDGQDDGDAATRDDSEINASIVAVAAEESLLL